MKSPRRAQSGIALILVIWVVTLLLVIAGSFLYATQTDVRAMRNAAELARMEAVARAALARALIELLKPPTQAGVWRRNPGPRQWAFDGMQVTVSLLDESARIDINFANPALLSGALKRAGLDEEEVARLVDAIQDWRDADSLRRPNGAEEPEYVAAGLQGRPANQLFQSIEELQLVLGMRPETYRLLSSMFTVFSRQPGVNPHFASRSTLLAIPSATEDSVDEYLRQRDAAFSEGLPPPPFPVAGAFASYSASAAVTLRADVAADGGAVMSREAVALLTPQYPRRPYALLAWREIPRANLGMGSLATETTSGGGERGR